MLKNLIFIFVSILISFSSTFAQLNNAPESKLFTVRFDDCGNQNLVSNIKAKFYICDKEGQYNHVSIHDCSKNRTTMKLNIIYKNDDSKTKFNDLGLKNLKQELITYEKNDNYDFFYVYDLYDPNTDELLATEFKDFNSNVVTLIVH